MLDNAAKLSPFDADTEAARTAGQAAAFELGFSKVDLWNLDHGICRVLSEIWAIIDPAVVEDFGIDPDLPDAVILACARDGLDDQVDEAIHGGLLVLPRILGAIGHEQLEKIGKLVVIFAGYTASWPAQLVDTVDEWRAALEICGNTIVSEAPKVARDPDYDTTALDGALEFLIGNFRNLWD